MFAGLANGVDFTQPESGLVRPDEFVFRFAQNAQMSQLFSMDMSSTIMANQ